MAAATAITAASSDAWLVVAAFSPPVELPAGLPSVDPLDSSLVVDAEEAEALEVPVALGTELRVVATSRDPEAVGVAVMTAVESVIKMLDCEPELPALVAVPVACGAEVDPSTLLGSPTPIVAEITAPVELALADEPAELESESDPELEPEVSKPALATAASMAFWGTLQLDWIGLSRSLNLVSEEHHWFMQMTTSDRKLPLAFSHMQSVLVGAHPFCRTQLVMQVGNWTAACAREPNPTRAAYTYCCFANILNSTWVD